MNQLPIVPLDTVDALVRSVTILFVLSLAVERITEFLKSRDWQPLSNLSGVKRVNLRTGRQRTLEDASLTLKTVEFVKNIRKKGDEKVADRAPADAGDAMSADERQRLKRAANAENTMLIGIALAFLTGANALDGLTARMTIDNLSGAWPYVQIALTGAAAGIGSSFWYDLLRLLTEVRRTREELAKPKLDIPPLLQPGKVKPPAR